MASQEKLSLLQEKLIDHTIYVIEGGITEEDEPIAPLVQAVVSLQGCIVPEKRIICDGLPLFPTGEVKVELPKEELSAGPLNWMREARRKMKLTQLQLSREVNTTQWIISEIERGIQRPKKQLAMEISEVLGVPLEKFINHYYEKDE